MNISKIGAGFSTPKVSSVLFNKVSSPFKTANSADVVSFTGVKKVKIQKDKKELMDAANSLSNSTSGHRAIYGSSLFDKDLMEVFAVGVAEYAKEHAAQNGKKEPVVMIGGDTRVATKESIPLIVDKLKESGVKVYQMDEPVATPLLAAMAEENADKIDISILMTASHNPWEYGGFNMVTPDGAIAPSSVTKNVASHIQEIGDRGFFYSLSEDKQKDVKMVNPYELYKEKIEESGLIDFDNIRESGITIYYDSLSGTGEYVVPKLMEDAGIEVNNIKTKASDIKGPEPNAENLSLLSQKIVNDPAELKIGLSNDGDADRFGIIDTDGSYITPNDVLLLTAYHLHKNKGKEGAIVRSQATTAMLDEYANANNLKTFVTPVGFKFLAEEIINERENGRDIIVAGEESGGLTVANHIPEKDGVIAIMLMADLMATEKKPLKEILTDIKKDIDVHFESFATSKTLNSDEDKNKIMAKMEKIYDGAVNEGKTDFLPGFEIDAEKTKAHHDKMIEYKGNSDGIKLIFTNDAQLTVRKSGTEPKIRLYIETKGSTDEEAKQNNNILQQQVDEIFTV